MEKMNNFCRTKSTETLIQSLRMIGVPANREQTLARVAIANVLEERHGWDFVEPILDEIDA